MDLRGTSFIAAWVKRAWHLEEMQELAHHIYSIALGEIGPEEAVLPIYSYCVLDEQRRRALWIDAPFEPALAAARELATRGIVSAGMLLTHRHIVGLSTAWARARAQFEGLPFLLHPLDAQHEQAFRWNPAESFENPLDHPLLRSFQLVCRHFPGHTSGHVLVQHVPTSVWFVGDSAMTHGPGREPALMRPPAPFSMDDDRLRASWCELDENIATIAPFHGLPVHGIADWRLALRKEEVTTADSLVLYQREQDLADRKTYIKE